MRRRKTIYRVITKWGIRRAMMYENSLNRKYINNYIHISYLEVWRGVVRIYREESLCNYFLWDIDYQTPNPKWGWLAAAWVPVHNGDANNGEPMGEGTIYHLMKVRWILEGEATQQNGVGLQEKSRGQTHVKCSETRVFLHASLRSYLW